MFPAWPTRDAVPEPPAAEIAGEAVVEDGRYLFRRAGPEMCGVIALGRLHSE
jgi:hypothetical protein